MNIFLGGGGGEVQSKELDDYFVLTMIQRSLSKLDYLPIAAEKKKYKGCLEWFEGIFNNRVASIEMWCDLKEKSFLGLENKAAVYIGGGNTGRLISQIMDTGLELNLKGFIQNGGLFYGGSAGAIILGKSILTAPEEETADCKYSTGLNLLNNYSVACHYDRTKNSRDRYMKLSKSVNSPIIALTERAGLVFLGNRKYLFGEGEISIFRGGEELLVSKDTLTKRKGLFPVNSFLLH